MTKPLLIIFVKNPVLGKVKTRLAQTIGDKKALEVYKALLEQTKVFADTLPVERVVYYDGHIEESDLWSKGKYDKRLQYDGDLGERMYNAFKDSFLRGYNRICIIGSDCYQLTSEIVNEAFRSLDDYDAVIGPANDGGYYLLGMNSMIKEVFTDKSWSKEALLAETQQSLDDRGKSYELLKELIDVDTEADLVASGFML